MKELESDPILKAKRFIEANYGSNISLEDIAGAASLSKYYFVRLFEKETGCAPWEYLTRTRVRAAMQLLAGSRTTVNEIAVACGFANASGLIRVFRRYADCTPGAFRRQFRSKPGETVCFGDHMDCFSP
ncbi:MAG: helix-turn-helix transcriptional regulator [Blautia sp.]|nr:helix-turn-helix transcriptional regulator [Blautia sp.]